MKAEKIWFDNDSIHLRLDDGREGALPLKAFPRLYNATEQQRESYTLSPMGIHWEEIDEDLSYEGFFRSGMEETMNSVAQILTLFPELNVSQLAKRMGINQSLLAKYACGNKNPSPKRLKEIESTLRALGRELSSVTLA